MKKYLVNYTNNTIETQTGSHAELAVKIHPERCFDKFIHAKQAIIKNLKAKRNQLNIDIQKLYLLTNNHA